MLHDICVGKTGTITKGKMDVAMYQFCDQIVAHRRETPDSFSDRLEIQTELKELVKESIVCNTDVRFEPSHSPPYVFKAQGQELEVGMVQFLTENNEDVHRLFINRNRYQEKVAQLPFCQTRKRKIVVRKVKDDDTQVRVYLKGAPEYVLALCTETFDYQMSQREMDDDERYRILDEVVSTAMASNGLKTLAYAYKQMPIDDLHDLMSRHHIESDDFRNEIESNMVYLCCFGIDDPIREEVNKSIQLIRYGTVLADNVDRSKGAKNQVNIRMITGDHVSTALHVALKAGIISHEDQHLEGVYMTGDQFRASIGEYQKVWDAEKMKYVIKFADYERFKRTKGRLRIIARASAEDKLLLIAGIS